MRLPLLAGSLAFALAALAAAADPDVPKAAPSPAAATPPAPATAPPASEVAKKPQSPPPAEAEAKKPAQEQDKRALAATYLKQCMQDWDAATHMTKKEWERTCRRVVDGRMRFMFDQMGK